MGRDLRLLSFVALPVRHTTGNGVDRIYRVEVWSNGTAVEERRNEEN